MKQRTEIFDYHNLIMKTSFYLVYLKCKDWYYDPENICNWELACEKKYTDFNCLSIMMCSKYGWDKLEDFLIFAINDLERLLNDLVACGAGDSVFYLDYKFCKEVFTVLLYALRKLKKYGVYDE